ncbi:hypothetical protein BHE74_00042089 [Ensete ventricosum]|uniref:Uncharacterized protein n=1 Tax=Ensete ventricosum TaxID=4639 RepID=A0A427B4Y1_ENSVE|nr:hypothetical protein B296_00017413 [Ensete ventricosum]RWW51556.1 hypothetical protein BHE74_00042089 [Ensete ventricosum]RZR88136.1 hypothetical protein BHM03_00015656 [Ensete ventricosum]
MVAIKVTGGLTDRWAALHLRRSFCEAESLLSSSLCSALLRVAVIEKPTSMEDSVAILSRRT